MPKCKCACHEEEEKSKSEKFVLSLIETSRGFFKVSIWILIIMFLFAGAYSSVIMAVQMYPDFAPKIDNFLSMSSYAGQFAMYGLIVFVVTSLSYLAFFKKKKEKGGKFK